MIAFILKRLKKRRIERRLRQLRQDQYDLAWYSGVEKITDPMIEKKYRENEIEIDDLLACLLQLV